MRTLKRTICLVLSVVMLLGLCAISVSADGTNLDKYTDKNSITYKEAVDVLTGIGVLQGDAAGFRPKDNVTRAEAAKIIAYLLIGDASAADALKAVEKPFTDVETTYWAAGYIAYCAEQKIVNGLGDGRFNPTGNVTGIEFAKMLLGAIGYGVQGEYTGAAWAINVAKDGVQYGIYDGNLAGASETPATREECALYAFNTLTLNKVTYSELFGGYIENTVNQAQSNKWFTIADDYGLQTTELVDAATRARFGYGQVYTGSASVDSDMFYRPLGHFWYQRQEKNTVSGYYGGEEDYLLHSFNTPVTGADLFDTLGSALVSELYKGDIPLVIYENGGAYDGSDYAGDEFGLDYGARMRDLPVASLNAVRRGNNDVLAHTGYGVETNVYAITNNKGDVVEVRITLVHTYFAQVSSYKPASGGYPQRR